jgi:acyl-CoA synthetase (AMP-forming)/AMP-acid ligase II
MQSLHLVIKQAQRMSEGHQTIAAGLLAPLAAGAAVILPKEGRFAAGTFWRDACEHRATFYTAVPTMHQILLSRAGASVNTFLIPA